jgi:hypothetical protein
MKCKKCGENFPCNIRIKGKAHNLQNRKFCLSCSPFGKHNTKDITKECKVDGNKICNCCGSRFNTNQLRGYKCWNCLNKQAKLKNQDKLYELMGDKCCLCGYNRCRAAMDFHHMDREKKSHGLSQREMTYAWERIVEESKKCVLLCAVCHREYHSGIISQEAMNEAYKKIHFPPP